MAFSGIRLQCGTILPEFYGNKSGATKTQGTVYSIFPAWAVAMERYYQYSRGKE
jgi:hypothetical protein